MTAPTVKIVSILARYGSEKYPNAEEELSQIFSSQLQETAVESLVVDNSLPLDFCPVQRGTTRVIAGNNSAWEFSAWNRGIEFLGPEIWSYDLVHLGTSAFNTLYTTYLQRFDSRMLRAIVGRPVCLGHIDCYNEAVRLLYFRSQHWLRTSFIFIPVAELKMLGSLVSLIDSSQIFGHDPNTAFLPDAPISNNYQKLILDWLIGKDIGQGSTWHSKFSLDQATFGFFKSKATAILNEQLFGLRLRAQGTQLIDVTWLATQLISSEPEAIMWNTPWRQQLAGRDRDQVLCGQ